MTLKDAHGNKIWANIIATIFLVIALIGGIVTATSAWVGTQHSLKNVNKNIKEMRIENHNTQQELRVYTADSWSKKNDKIFMKKYSQTNKLIMPEHYKTIP
tara:strand:+ start:263 stop:565 length:303 start_codon:yes stop_codon:yes gene_type:complete